MAADIKIGISGCGMIARKSHIEGFNSISGVEVSALFDNVKKKAEDCRRRAVPRAMVFSNYYEFLSSGINAVSVCSPTVYHYRQSVAALEKGLNVFCEKPMTDDILRATLMVNAAKRAGKVLHINQSLRYSPVYRKIAALIEQGKIGELLHMRCIRGARGTPAGKDGWSPGAQWFVSRKQGGGVLLDIGIHMADLFRWYGGEISEIAADVRNMEGRDGAAESAVSVFRFKSGATGSLDLKWNLGNSAGSLEIYGTEGVLRLGFRGGVIEHIPEGKPATDAKMFVPYKKVKSSFRNFFEAVTGERASETPGELGRDALALCDAMAKSSARGRFVRVKSWK